MALLRHAYVTPRGIVLERPLRLMVSPFSPYGTAMQEAQPWTTNLMSLSKKQMDRIKALVEAAKAAKGTYGTVFNPRTGRLMPAIAAEVAARISGKLTPEERLKRRREAAAAYRLKKPHPAGYEELRAIVGF
jgi:hypothetical protein